jgi:hypothetical protein
MRLRKECWDVLNGDLRSDHFLARESEDRGLESSKTGDSCKCFRLSADSDIGVKCGFKLQGEETNFVFLCCRVERFKLFLSGDRLSSET